MLIDCLVVAAFFSLSSDVKTPHIIKVYKRLHFGGISHLFDCTFVASILCF